MAREIADFMQQGGGLITVQDLKNYDVIDRTPVRGTYRGLEIISAPPPSSGGIALVETLNILEGFDLAKAGFGSAEAIHLIAESYRRAFYDRAQFLGDPEFSDLPVSSSPTKNTASIGARRSTRSRRAPRAPRATASVASAHRLRQQSNQ